MLDQILEQREATDINLEFGDINNGCFDSDLQSSKDKTSGDGAQ